MPGIPTHINNTVFHAKRVECAIFHLLVNISGILHARPTYDISSRSPIFGDHFFSLTPMNLDFLCLTKRDLDNQRFDSLFRNGAGSPNFYLAQTCHPRVWFCSRSFRP